MMAPQARPRRPREERGSVSPLGVALVFALLAALAFTVDLSAAMAQAARQNEYVQTARETVEETGNGFLIKNAEDPFKELSQQVVDSLRKQGYDGSVFVFMTEAPQGYSPAAGKSLPDDRRVIGYTVVLSGNKAPSVFSKLMGKNGQDVKTDKTMTTVLYSSGTCWRPAGEIDYLYNGIYQSLAVAPAGKSTITGPVQAWDMQMFAGDEECNSYIAAAKQAMDSRSDAYR